MFEHIEKVKREYTDKYVAVDGDRPELARFKDFVGQVQTVNISGRALVEFMDYHLNIGWYDIDLDYLKVVDKPAPKPEKKRSPPRKNRPLKSRRQRRKLRQPEKKLSPLEMARQADSGGAKKKQSTSAVFGLRRWRKVGWRKVGR